MENNKSGIKHTPFLPLITSVTILKQGEKASINQFALFGGSLHRPQRPREYAVRGVYSG